MSGSSRRSAAGDATVVATPVRLSECLPLERSDRAPGGVARSAPPHGTATTPPSRSAVPQRPGLGSLIDRSVDQKTPQEPGDGIVR